MSQAKYFVMSVEAWERSLDLATPMLQYNGPLYELDDAGDRARSAALSSKHSLMVLKVVPVQQHVVTVDVVSGAA